MSLPLPIYQHPVLTVLVDDSQSYLDSITFQLDAKLACKTFTDTEAAINWIKAAYRHYRSDLMPPIHVGYDDETSSLERRNATIDLNEIYFSVLNKQRHHTPAILVVDYAMPEMNGLQFCKALQGLPCKKILLTGQADERIAVEAFNHKLIDQFIRKNDPAAMDQLATAISYLKTIYFSQLTSTLKDLLTRHTYAFLADAAIAALAEQLCQQYGFVEHYLFPNPAGILFVDAHGKPSLMVVETDTSLLAHYEIAELQNAPEEMLSALAAHAIIPFFSDSEGVYDVSLQKTWASYCRPSNRCRGTQDYYWSIFELPTHYLPENIYPYAQFLIDSKTPDAMPASVMLPAYQSPQITR